MQQAQAGSRHSTRPNRPRAALWAALAAGAALLVGFFPAASPELAAPRAEAAGVTHWTVGAPVQAKLDGALFWPVYFPITYGTNTRMLGLFDYRPQKTEEAIIAARSNDGGLNWISEGKALDFTGINGANPDVGQGHPFATVVGGKVFMYTLDRQPVVKDIGGLTVHRLTGDLNTLLQNPLAGVPPTELPPSPPLVPSGTVSQTVGLLNPDGMLASLPAIDISSGSPRFALGTTSVLYLQKQLGDVPLHDVTTLRWAKTTDGINFTDLGAVSGITDASTIFVGPHGTLTRISDGGSGRWGLFFSGGIPADNDSDAFHYIGYAESTDLRHWTVVNGLTNPIVSCNPTNPAGLCNLTDPTQAQTFYAGRVYSPSVTFGGSDGRSATLTFAAYRTSVNANDKPGNRVISVATLQR